MPSKSSASGTGDNGGGSGMTVDLAGVNSTLRESPSLKLVTTFASCLPVKRGVLMLFTVLGLRPARSASGDSTLLSKLSSRVGLPCGLSWVHELFEAELLQQPEQADKGGPWRPLEGLPLEPPKVWLTADTYGETSPERVRKSAFGVEIGDGAIDCCSISACFS